MSKQIIKESLVDIYFLFAFLRKLTTPFNEWKAFKLGIIDANGNVLRKRATLNTVEEKNSFTVLDVLALNIKKAIEKLPGGKSRLASFLGAMFLMKESKIGHELSWYLDEDILYEAFLDYYEVLLTSETMKNFAVYLSESKRVFSREDALKIGNILGIDWNKVDLEQFRQGLSIETEHEIDPETQVAFSDIDLGKIALAHLKELPDYYTRLKKVEEDAPANSVAGGGIAGMREPIIKRKLKKFRQYNEDE